MKYELKKNFEFKAFPTLISLDFHDHNYFVKSNLIESNLIKQVKIKVVNIFTGSV